jgi:hypothetical protein
MKHTYILLIVLLVFYNFGCKLLVRDGEIQSLNYQISYIASSEHRLLVQLQFEGDSSGKTKMIMPHEWAWQDSYEKGIKNLQLLSLDGQLTLADNGIDYEISHPAGQTIIIQYEVKPYWEGQIYHEVYYRPIIKPGYFHFIGHGVFAYPEWNLSVPRQIRVEWKGIPDDWQMANSFGVNKEEQSHPPPQQYQRQRLSRGRGIIRNCRSTNITKLPILSETKQTYYFDLLSYLNLQTSVPNQRQLPNHLSTIFCHHRRLQKNSGNRITQDRLVEALLLD